MTSTAAALLSTPCEAAANEDARWVAAARGGDPDATFRLLARCRPPLVRLLAGMLGDWAGAEDLAQEAFLKAFRGLDRLRDPSRFYPWVRRLAVRLALRELRGRRDVSLDSLGSLDYRADQAEWSAGSESTARVDTRLAVQEVLACLPPDLRAVLVLRELEGLGYAEIAETLGTPMGTVRSRLFAARERFRALWREIEGESGA